MRLKHVLLIPTTVPVTTRTNKNIPKQIIHFHHCPFLHPLDKFVELFKPKYCDFDGNTTLFRFELFYIVGQWYINVSNHNHNISNVATKDFTTMILFTIASSSKVLIHNSFIFFGAVALTQAHNKYDPVVKSSS